MKNEEKKDCMQTSGSNQESRNQNVERTRLWPQLSVMHDPQLMCLPPHKAFLILVSVLVSVLSKPQPVKDKGEVRL